VGLHAHPAPDRRGSTAERKRDQNRIRRHRDKNDPRKLLFAGRQPQMVQLDLRQPRAKLAPADDRQAEDAVRAQRSLKIVRVAENRRGATWHFALSRSAWIPLSCKFAVSRRSRYPISAETSRGTPPTVAFVSRASRNVPPRRGVASPVFLAAWGASRADNK